MNHSILDGTRSDSFAGPGTTPALGRAAVRDWMSRAAVAVTADTDFATMVAAITASRRGVLPVVEDSGEPVGVVAASDLLGVYATQETGHQPRTEITARDLMTVPAVTITEDETVGEAVRRARRESVHHLPVVDGAGRLVGMLSPHDLLDSLRADDQAIRAEAIALALTPGSGVVPGSLQVRCEHGQVVLAGRTRTRTDAAALCLQVARIEGLAALTDHLRWDIDDTEQRHPGKEDSDEQRDPATAAAPRPGHH